MSRKKIRDSDGYDDFNKISGGIATGTKVNQTLRNANIGPSSNYKIFTPPKTTTVLGITDKTLGKIDPKTNLPRGEWLARFDGPHRGAEYPHINLNPKITKVPDPHTPISPGTLNAIGKTHKVLKTVQKVALPVAIAVDTYRIGTAIAEDYNSGESVPKNTIKTGAGVAGAWAGGYAGGYGGAWTGAAVGSMAGPVGTAVGAITGGIVGGIGGAIGGDYGATAIANSYLDDDDEYCDGKHKTEKERKNCKICSKRK